MDSFRRMSARDKKISLYLIGILLIIIVYMFVWNPLMDKYSILKAEQDELQREVDLLQEVNANITEYKTKSGILETEINEFLSDFKPDIKEEDSIIFTKSLEDSTDVSISQVDLSQRYFVYTIGAETTEEGAQMGEVVAADSILIPETLYASPMSIQLEGTYEQIKECINEINTDENRKGISSVALSYDGTTGMLFGEISMNNFFLTDSAKVYSEPELSSISLGVDDIFGTINIEE